MGLVMCEVFSLVLPYAQRKLKYLGIVGCLWFIYCTRLLVGTLWTWKYFDQWRIFQSVKTPCNDFQAYWPFCKPNLKVSVPLRTLNSFLLSSKLIFALTLCFFYLRPKIADRYESLCNLILRWKTAAQIQSLQVKLLFTGLLKQLAANICFIL